MGVKYTNRKGRTYFLCKGLSKTGKPRYFFAREPKGEPVKQIPEGYAISESVNGVVSLVKSRPAQILPAELAAVQAEVQRHPKAKDYRVSVKHDRITVYERVGPATDEILTRLNGVGVLTPGAAERLDELFEQRSQFEPVLRFILADAEGRTFRVQRSSYRGSASGWHDIGAPGPVHQLARHAIPALGSKRFFELF